MSDPQPAPGRRTPPRAEPIQPDKPGRGTDAEAPADAGDDALKNGGAPATDAQQEQNETARENVREGYR